MKTTCLVLKLGVLLLLFTTPACKKAEIAKPAQNSKGGVEALVNPDQMYIHAGSIRGSVDGAALQAQFDCPTFLSVGPAKSLYVYDASFNVFAKQLNANHRKIRKITRQGIVTTFYKVAEHDADITGMVVDKDGNVYISQKHQIKKISADGTTIKVVAGNGYAPTVRKDGPALEATFSEPAGLAINKEGCLFIMDKGYNVLRKLSNNIVTVVAGGNKFDCDRYPNDGIGVNAEFDLPQFLSIDNEDNLYVTGGYYAIFRKVTPTGEVTTVSQLAQIYTITQTAVDQSGNLYYCIYRDKDFDFKIFQFILGEAWVPDYHSTYFAQNYYPLEETNGVFVPADGLLYPTGFAIIDNMLYFSNTIEHKIRAIELTLAQ